LLLVFFGELAGWMSGNYVSEVLSPDGLSASLWGVIKCFILFVRRLLCLSFLARLLDFLFNFL
jgi:hypothetical protein